MATHSSVLAWRIPGTGEPGGLLSVRSHRVGHDWSDLAAAAAAGTGLKRMGSVVTEHKKGNEAKRRHGRLTTRKPEEIRERISPCPWLPSARWSFLPLDYLWRFFPHSHQAASLLLASFLSRPSTTYPLLEEWSAVLGPSYLLLITNLLLRQFFSSPLAVFP